MNFPNDTVPDDLGPESHPLGWNRREWVIRELQAPLAGDPETEGTTEPVSGYS